MCVCVCVRVCVCACVCVCEHLHMFLVNDWCLVHKLLQIIVQKLKDKIELSVTVQYLH